MFSPLIGLVSSFFLPFFLSFFFSSFFSSLKDKISELT